MNVNPRHIGAVAIVIAILLALTALYALWAIAGAFAEGSARAVVTLGLIVLTVLGVLS